MILSPSLKIVIPFGQGVHEWQSYIQNIEKTKNLGNPLNMTFLVLGYKSVLIASSLGFISIQTKLVHLVAELSLQK